MNLLSVLAKVSGITLLSRITGLIRDSLIARAFGVSDMTDAFQVAFRIPNLLRRLFAEGAFSQAFVPILAETRGRGDEAETRSLIDHTAGTLALILLIVSIIGVLCAPWIVHLTAPGFAGKADKFDGTVQMLRITFPYIFFIALTGFGGAVLNTWQKFSLPAFTSVLLNLTFIGCTLWLAPLMRQPVEALAWAVAIGGVAQLALQWWGLGKMGLMPRFRIGFSHPGVRRILKQMAPALLGVSVAQISLLLNTAIASALITGSITWISNADRLMEFPTGMLGVALGTILLPSLSKAAKTDQAHYSNLLDWGLRLVLLLALPGALGLAMLSVPLVSTLYHYGLYTEHDVYATQYAVLGYSVGLAGLILVKVLAPGFYAQQDMRTPVRYAIFTLVLTQIFNFALIYTLPKTVGHAGLALAISLGACTNAALLWRGLVKRGAYRAQPGWGLFLLKLLAALAVMGVCLWFLNPAGDIWIKMRAQPWLRAAYLGGIVTAGALVYFATLWALGFRLRDFKRTA